MNQKTFGFITLLLIIFSIILFNLNSEYITKTNHINLLSETGEKIPSQIIYCRSRNYYQVQGDRYIKFSNDDKVIEKGNFKDVYFNTYSIGTKYAILSLAIILSIFHILFLYYKKQNSPFQKIKDHQIQKNKKSFIQLPKKEKEIIINKNSCIKCKTDPKLKFVEEIHDIEWDITQVYFHCERCGDQVKIRR